MATAITQANFEAACGECYDAIASESWKSAWLWYARSEAQNAALATSSEAGGMSMSRRDRLEGLRTALEAAEAAASRYSMESRVGRLGTRHRT